MGLTQAVAQCFGVSDNGPPANVDGDSDADLCPGFRLVICGVCHLFLFKLGAIFDVCFLPRKEVGLESEASLSGPQRELVSLTVRHC